MNLDSLIFDLEMAHRRLPEIPDYEPDDDERQEWRALRGLIPQLIELAKSARRFGCGGGYDRLFKTHH